MKCIIIDKHYPLPVIWIIPISDYKNSHQLKLLIKTYNDVHNLGYIVKVFKKIPSRFFGNNYIIEYTNYDMIRTMAHEIKQKLK